MGLGFDEMKVFRLLVQLLLDKKRIPYLLTFLILIPLGLYSRIWFRSMEAQCEGGILCFWGEFAPDALYATMYYVILRWIWIHKSQVWAALWALLLCYAIEILQLYHAEWIDAVRATRLGGLILGFSFLWSDIVCYTVGVVAGWGIDVTFLRNRGD